MHTNLLSIRQFASSSSYTQLCQLNQSGINTGLLFFEDDKEYSLFCYHDFYVEMVVGNSSNEILSIHCFRQVSKLNAYLAQIDISKLVILLQPK